MTKVWLGEGKKERDSRCAKSEWQNRIHASSTLTPPNPTETTTSCLRISQPPTFFCHTPVEQEKNQSSRLQSREIFFRLASLPTLSPSSPNCPLSAKKDGPIFRCHSRQRTKNTHSLTYFAYPSASLIHSIDLVLTKHHLTNNGVTIVSFEVRRSTFDVPHSTGVCHEKSR